VVVRDRWEPAAQFRIDRACEVVRENIGRGPGHECEGHEADSTAALPGSS
jgi:hypothetical protein